MVDSMGQSMSIRRPFDDRSTDNRQAIDVELPNWGVTGWIKEGGHLFDPLGVIISQPDEPRTLARLVL